MPSRADDLTDPARASFRAAQQIVVQVGPPWQTVASLPKGEVLWQDAVGRLRDEVILTSDGGLVYVNAGDKVMHVRRMRAMPELVAAIRGGPGMRLRSTQAEGRAFFGLCGHRFAANAS